MFSLDDHYAFARQYGQSLPVASRNRSRETRTPEFISPLETSETRRRRQQTNSDFIARLPYCRPDKSYFYHREVGDARNHASLASEMDKYADKWGAGAKRRGRQRTGTVSYVSRAFASLGNSLFPCCDGVLESLMTSATLCQLTVSHGIIETGRKSMTF